VDEADVKPRSTTPDSSRSKPHPLGTEPLNGAGQIVGSRQGVPILLGTEPLDGAGQIVGSRQGVQILLGTEPLDGARQIVHPQAGVVQGCRMHRRLPVGVERLHQIDFDLERARPGGADVLIDVFALADEGTCHLQSEQIDPETAQARFVRTSDGDLLHALYLKRYARPSLQHTPRWLIDHQRLAFAGQHLRHHAIGAGKAHIFHLHRFDDRDTLTRLSLLSGLRGNVH